VRLTELAGACFRLFGRAPEGTDEERAALQAMLRATAYLAAWLYWSDAAVQRVIGLRDLEQLLRNRICAANCPEAAGEVPAVGFQRLEPDDSTRVLAPGGDVLLAGLDEADQVERRRVLRALEFSIGWQRAEPGPGRPTGRTGAYKYPTRETLVAAIRDKVYPWPKSTGRPLDSFSQKEIARRLKLSLRTMQQRMGKYGITWDDIYKQRL
jgi:hypothetical protein